MKVKELIEELKKFDGELEVQYDFDGGFGTVPIDKVYKSTEDYFKDNQEVVVLY